MLAKRALDILLSAVLLILSLPVMVVVGLCVRFSMGRPILFRQMRPGLSGQPFEILKFRTMKCDSLGLVGVDSDGLRLTKVGQILRSTSLDELPELWNVLRGDMSLVGPRPLLMQYLGRYTLEQSRRHDVRPGLTGWAQVNGRNALSWEEKFALDLWYVNNRSLCVDIKILLLTVWLVLSRRGITADNAATMPEFLGTKQNGGHET